jgi:hypothetical protein
MVRKAPGRKCGNGLDLMAKGVGHRAQSTNKIPSWEGSGVGF